MLQEQLVLQQGPLHNFLEFCADPIPVKAPTSAASQLPPHDSQTLRRDTSLQTVEPLPHEQPQP
uniref:Uncharacterized protein n=1 Tax=Peronospora matthiolae TaxID=2874970 RepID=A0AAV1UMB2_9STRA